MKIKYIGIIIAFLLLNLFLILTAYPNVYAYSVKIYTVPSKIIPQEKNDWRRVGMTIGWKTDNILIVIDETLPDDEKNSVVLHEVSHIIYSRELTPKERNLFKQMYKKTRGMYCYTEYGATSDFECFAEVVPAIILGKINPTKNTLASYTNFLIKKYSNEYLKILKTNIQENE